MIAIAVLQDQFPSFDISGLMTIIIIVTVIAVIIPLIFSFRMLRNVLGGMAQTRTLMANGVPAQATILKMWDTGTTVNDNPLVGLLLEVRPQDRPAYQVQTQSLVSRLKIPLVQTGATVPVKFDPSDPAKVALDLP